MRYLNRMAAVLALLFTINASLAPAHAQGTAFTYQGQLSNGTNPASGLYAFKVDLFNNPATGTLIGGPITNSAVIVSNGLFTMVVDFGAGVFTGGSNWLHIQVATNGTGAFTSLAPRQQVTPTPYAIFAEAASNVNGTLSATQLSGTVGSANLSGTYGNAVTFNNAGNSFTGAFTGNGGGLTNLNASQLSSGTVPNSVQSGFQGNDDTISGGENDFITSSTRWATIGGGNNNTNLGCDAGTISGGQNNAVTNGLQPTVGGGKGNTAGNAYATVGGGYLNTANGEYATAGGGSYNIASGPGAFIGGGGFDGGDLYGNLAAGAASVVGGGLGNVVTTNGYYGVVGGGYENTNNSTYATVGGGAENTASAGSATVGGGNQNTASGEFATVGGGTANTAGNGEYATVGGGVANKATNNYATVSGGGGNTASGIYATVAGGTENTASGGSSFVGGGQQNLASGSISFAAGQNAQPTNNNAFVWSDGSATTTSTADHQFMVRASGGVIIYSSSGASSGVSLAAGDGTWSSLSDRNAKDDFAPVTSGDVLARVAALPITQWSYKTQPGVRHLGPMAQDFHTAFALGVDDRHITEVDEAGVALAAIQGLNQKLEAQKVENAELKARLEKLEQLLNVKAEKTK